MKLEYKPMSREERLYAYPQSHQISVQCGIVGCLAGNFGKAGAEYQAQWKEYAGQRETESFLDELNDVVGTMRLPGGPLRDRYAMAAFCGMRESASFQGEGALEYAFRVDTAHYSYMLRCDPSLQNCNFHIWCYERINLEAHMAVAEQGIRFITPDYREKFRIQDGEMIRVSTPNGEPRDCVCRYIDQTHLEVGKSLFHICEYAEILKRSGASIIPLRSALPDKCFAALETDNEMVLVKKGEMGYEHTGIFPEGGQEKQEAADALNDAMGVTKAQAAAMLAGSMFGWDASAADPKNYDENGTPIRGSDWSRGER